MALPNEERKSKLEQLKDSLYDKYADIKPKPRARLHAHTDRVEDAWSEDDVVLESRRPTSQSPWLGIATKLFVGALVFFILAIGFVALRLWKGGNAVSTDDVEISIFTQGFVDGGETFDLVVRIQNGNPAPLELADLILEYPETSLVDGERHRERVSLGTIGAGETAERDFSLQLFGEEGEERPITAKIEYRVAGSNAIFVKESTEQVGIQSTPIELAVEGPETGVSNQESTFEVTVTSNATAITENVMLRAEYPQGFVYADATPQPSYNTYVWYLGDLAPGESRTVEITGTLGAETGSEMPFRFYLGTEDPAREAEIATLFSSELKSVRLIPAFINASVIVNDGSASGTVATVAPGARIEIDIPWTNTLPVAVNNAVITASFSGSAYDASSIDTISGFFDSNQNLIRWDGSNTSGLDVIEPGATGTLSFTMMPKPLVSGGSTVISSPAIVVAVNVEGVNTGGSVQGLQQIASKEIKVASQLSLEPRTLYFDGPFQNAGDVPPSVGAETEYTLSWRVSNTSNRIEDAKLTTRLPAYVVWKSATSPAGQDIQYNNVTRELVWNIDTVDAGAGFTKASEEVYFKVGITPSTSQQGSTPALTESLVLIGNDTYTGEPVRVVRNPHTTQLLNDISVESGRVQ